jgi:hypothetical protein
MAETWTKAQTKRKLGSYRFRVFGVFRGLKSVTRRYLGRFIDRQHRVPRSSKARNTRNPRTLRNDERFCLTKPIGVPSLPFPRIRRIPRLKEIYLRRLRARRSCLAG